MTAQTCTDHCRVCGEHFHGLTAFDLHREGEFGEDRDCVDPARVGRLQAWTEAGRCTLGRQPLEEPVTVWQAVKTAAQAAFVAGNRRRLPSEVPF